MKPMCRSSSLRFSALSLLATVSLTGNPVIAAEPKSHAQQQAREPLSGLRQASELLSGTSRDLSARSVPVTARAATATHGRPDAQRAGRRPAQRRPVTSLFSTPHDSAPLTREC
jgi:hypothetical protein